MKFGNLLFFAGKACTALLLMNVFCLQPDAVLSRILKKHRTDLEISKISKSRPDGIREMQFVNFRMEKEMIAVSLRQKEFYADRYRIVQGRDGHYFSVLSGIPVSQVSFTEAESICRQMGKRLCTEIEWKKLCFLSFTASLHQQNQSCASEENQKFCYPGDCSQSESCIHNLQEIPENFQGMMEWVHDDKNDLPAAMGGSGDDALSFCARKRYPSSNYKSGELGFRCCRDK